MSSTVSVGLDIVRRMPLSLRRDYLARRDRAVRDILEHCHAPHLRHAVADALLVSPLRVGAAGPGLFGGPHLCMPATPGWGPQPMAPSFDVDAELGLPSDARIRRIPYCLASETSLAASTATATGSATDYLNGTGMAFHVSHLCMSQNGQGLTSLRVDPTYSMKLTSTKGRPWTKPSAAKVRASAMATFRTQWGPPQNSLPLCVWDFPGDFFVDASETFEATCENPCSFGAIAADLVMVCYKRTSDGQVLILADTKTLAASASRTYFDAGNFMGDGDYPFAVRQVLMSAGNGDWYAGAQATAPRYYIRAQRETFPFTARATIAPAMNNAEGGALGCHLKLSTPQVIPPNGAMTIEFTENDGVAATANVSLLGWLEQKIPGSERASA